MARGDGAQHGIVACDDGKGDTTSLSNGRRHECEDAIENIVSFVAWAGSASNAYQGERTD